MRNQKGEGNPLVATVALPPRRRKKIHLVVELSVSDWWWIPYIGLSMLHVRQRGKNHVVQWPRKSPALMVFSGGSNY
jgi:hypothetical protein